MVAAVPAYRDISFSWKKVLAPFSSVVGIGSLRLAIITGIRNGLKIRVADVISAYLNALTQEKVVFIASHEFGEDAEKACYG